MRLITTQTAFDMFNVPLHWPPATEDFVFNSQKYIEYRT